MKITKFKYILRMEQFEYLNTYGYSLPFLFQVKEN